MQALYKSLLILSTVSLCSLAKLLYTYRLYSLNRLHYGVRSTSKVTFYMLAIKVSCVTAQRSQTAVHYLPYKTELCVLWVNYLYELIREVYISDTYRNIRCRGCTFHHRCRSFQSTVHELYKSEDCYTLQTVRINVQQQYTTTVNVHFRVQYSFWTLQNINFKYQATKISVQYSAMTVKYGT